MTATVSLTDVAVTLNGGSPGEAPEHPIYTLSELLKEDFPPAVSVLGHGEIVRDGITVVGGGPKIGKTVLILNFVTSMAAGVDWLGLPTTRTRAVVLQAEVAEVWLQGRLRSMLTSFPHVIDPEFEPSFIYDRTLQLDTGAGYDVLARYLERSRAQYLVIDPLARFMAGDENGTRDMGVVVKVFDRVIQQLGVGVLVTHHTGKPPRDNPREGGHQLRGSSALFAAADSVLILERATPSRAAERPGDGEPVRHSLTFDFRHAPPRPPTTLTRTGGGFWFTPAEDTKPTRAPKPHLREVARLVQDIGLRYNALRQAIVKDLDVTPRTAERYINEAAAAGLVTETGGIYRHADEAPTADA